MFDWLHADPVELVKFEPPTRPETNSYMFVLKSVRVTAFPKIMDWATFKMFVLFGEERRVFLDLRRAMFSPNVWHSY